MLPCLPQFKPGDKVYALTGQHAFWSTYGTYAQYVSTHEATLAPIPAGVSYREAAAVPLAAMTAWQALQPSMPLQDKRVLVHAGAGGVGHFAIQVNGATGTANGCGSLAVLLKMHLSDTLLGLSH
jgi:NADPH:quinone reductase-like Zn-dependent oxidoreductase